MFTGINLITTVFCLRAPGMVMFRMPVFVWNQLVTAFLVLLAFCPPLFSALRQRSRGGRLTHLRRSPTACRPLRPAPARLYPPLEQGLKHSCFRAFEVL